ncbi:ABC transporter ATP-binding protein [Pseudooceanicola sp.]|uniref:ABC transporter ATP-binding protein n=1 Tax=Pseudooceanicola sp. TaxID=1914328 RepID=UPI0026036446|nr:ABC transporter ATP-binding protein [Pseudooceanicola sp.]MDF1854556.1 ABC transporter ATP-binding protein [Pseudooceanicola sp.]
MAPILQIKNLRKTYEGGFEALKGVSLDIEEGEIIALLGPNGAGKTTLISTLCGITIPTSGNATVGGFDIQRDFRAARNLIGLVPQEIALEQFETVGNAVRLTRGLFGKRRDDAHIDKVLGQLSLLDKKGVRTMALSGGMKRRVLIAKALSHDPRVLFLDEPTAGVDVSLRKEMWEVVAELKRDGVTIILTTHYLEEAEAIADRIAVINKGEILLVEETDKLMQRLGKKQLIVDLRDPLAEIPAALAGFDLALGAEGRCLIYTYDTQSERTGITRLLSELAATGINLRDLSTRQDSLEEIFVGLVREDAA